jgi:hypothetical protein
MNGEKGLFIGEKHAFALGKALPFRSGKGEKRLVQQNKNFTFLILKKMANLYFL